MLITNFASGELSKRLFGRIDLGQYFQGVSKLENFDPIPTGGISSRSGTKRIAKIHSNEKSRLIPFVVDRQGHIIVQIHPDGINVIYPNEIAVNTEDQKIRIDELTVTGDFSGYTEDEIQEVQYAHNHRTMILVHRNHPPLEITLNASDDGFNSVGVSVFIPRFEIEITQGAGITPLDESTLLSEDPTYIDNGWLTSPGNYPGCVTFFGGRLVFAGTDNDPQRIFASRVVEDSSDIYQFATFRYFLTEQKQYLVLRGSLQPDGRIELDDPNDGLRFTRPPTDYFIESEAFELGTKVTSIEVPSGGTGKSFITTFPVARSTPPAVWAGAVETAVTALITRFDDANTNRETNRVIVATAHTWNMFGADRYFRAIFSYGSSEYVMRWEQSKSLSFSTLVNFGDSKVRKIPSYLASYSDAYIASTIKSLISQTIQGMLIGQSQVGWNNNIVEEKPLAQDSIVDDWTLIIKDTMKYELKETGNPSNVIETFYDYGTDIYTRVFNRLKNTGDFFIPFYTRDVISDQYPIANDGFTFKIASDKSDSIRWLGLNKSLIIGTEMAEWVIPVGINATNLQAILNSRLGSDRMQGTTIGDAICFFQSGKKTLVEYRIPQEDTNFRANNMAMLNEEILRTAVPIEFDFVSTPFTKIFITLDDGSMAVLLYERNTGTFAWNHFKMSQGKIKSVATFPGQSDDEMYLLVHYPDEFGGNVFLEWYDQNGDVYLDSYSDADDGNYSDAMTHEGKIGYPIEAVVRSMPILANGQMKQNNIKALQVRFHDSYLPEVKSLYAEIGQAGEIREVKTDTINKKEPFTGVLQVQFPGVYDRDVYFEFVHDKPNRCRILAVNAEAN
jgi:hypothetical protein